MSPQLSSKLLFNLLHISQESLKKWLTKFLAFHRIRLDSLKSSLAYSGVRLAASGDEPVEMKLGAWYSKS